MRKTKRREVEILANLVFHAPHENHCPRYRDHERWAKDGLRPSSDCTCWRDPALVMFLRRLGEGAGLPRFRRGSLLWWRRTKSQG